MPIKYKSEKKKHRNTENRLDPIFTPASRYPLLLLEAVVLDALSWMMKTKITSRTIMCRPFKAQIYFHFIHVKAARKETYALK